MSNKNKQLADLFYNTVTVYFAPLLFGEIDADFSKIDFRLVLDDDLFEDGYLKKNISVKQTMAKLFLITDVSEFYFNQYIVHSYLGDIFKTENQIIIYKFNTFRLDIPIWQIADMQNILHLRTSALSRNSKKKIQSFWHRYNKQQVLFRVTDEMFPTTFVKQRLSRKLGIDSALLAEMPDITEAIKYGTDSLGGVMKQLGISQKD